MADSNKKKLEREKGSPKRVEECEGRRGFGLGNLSKS
jgi:hypothetical protein